MNRRYWYWRRLRVQHLTHINDASFWLFKGYFDLSVKDLENHCWSWSTLWLG
ncbi:MAG: hypothetical protein ACLRP3_09020 [Escherichia sp.]